MNLFHILERRAEELPDKTAVHFEGSQGPKTTTYRELHELASCFSSSLADAGVRKGDRVAIFLPNIPQYRTEVSGMKLDCADGTSTKTKSEYYDSANNLIYLSSQGTTFSDKEATSPFALLRRTVCDADAAGK